MKTDNTDVLWALNTVNEMVELGMIENTVERRAYMLGSLVNILAQGMAPEGWGRECGPGSSELPSPVAASDAPKGESRG